MKKVLADLFTDVVEFPAEQKARDGNSIYIIIIIMNHA